MEENANKLHFKCTDFNSSTYVLYLLSVFMCFYQNRVLIAKYNVDSMLTNTAVTSAVMNFWCHILIAKVKK